MKRHYIVAKVCLILLFSLNSRASNFSLNDISVLFPLPASEKINLLLGGDSIGTKGTLLPLEIVNQVPQLLKVATNEQVYPYIKVVGLRLDPCFTEGREPLRCQHQVRMVWQPLSGDDDFASTFDASLHSFYQLTEIEFQQLIGELKNLRSDYPVDNALLGVNPILKMEGLEGVFYQNLIKCILKFVGEKNLSRVTFMALGQDGNIWTFGGFDLVVGEMHPIAIPRASGFNLQVFRNSIKPEPILFNGGMIPDPIGADLINFLVKDSQKVTLEHESEIRAAVQAAFKIENPQLHNAGTVDCVSCHIAQAARHWTLNKFTDLDFLTDNQMYIYRSAFDLANQSPLQNKTNVLRAFGYLLDQPVVSQRTINETAESLRVINEQY